ncbi:hypothetical protein Tco_1459308 [Tanacetum coccineum]
MKMTRTPAGTDRVQRRRSGKEPASTSAPRETTTTTAGKTTTIGSKAHKQFASESALVQHLQLVSTTYALPSPDHAWKKSVPTVYESVQPWLSNLARRQDPRKDQQSHNLKIRLDQPKGRQYPHDLRQPLPLVPNSQGRHVIPFHHFINNDLEYLRGGESSRKYSTSVTKTTAADYGHIKWIEDLVPTPSGVK